jgi:hypothetical protein
VLNARGSGCGCVNGAWKFTPHARVVYLENERVRAHMMQGWINSARYKWSTAISFGEGRGPTWPFGTHHVDGGIWNASFWYVLVPSTLATRVAHVGNRACKSVALKTW